MRVLQRSGKRALGGSREPVHLIAASIVRGGLGVPAMVAAADSPLSFVADPSVYRVIGEDELFRVVLATWKPGQPDIAHSHPANVAYRLGDCKIHVYGPDGKMVGESEPKAGAVNLQKPIAFYSSENISSEKCQVLIVERK